MNDKFSCIKIIPGEEAIMPQECLTCGFVDMTDECTDCPSCGNCGWNGR